MTSSTLTDRYGLELSTASNAARDHYVEAVDRMLSANAGVAELLDSALAEDAEFALGYAAKARWLQLAGNIAGAREAADRGRELAGRVSEREQRHVDIMHNLVNGQGQKALGLIREHTRVEPLDALALSPAVGVFGLIGFSGRVDRESEQVALLEGLVDAYGDDWWFLTSYAFALVEFGRWEEGEAMVRRALEIHPRNAHGAHVLAHALYEGGKEAEAVPYLEQWLPEYDSDGQLDCHLWWHLAMFRLMLGEHDAIWPIYDEHCVPSKSTSPGINILSDGTSFLWRAKLAGVDGGASRWHELRAFGEATFPAPMVFVDVHKALPYAALGDFDDLGKYAETLDAAANDGKLPAGEVSPALARAFGDYARERWSDAIQGFERVLDVVVRIGGSRAQRDLVVNTLLSAYVHDGRVDAAKALLAKRDDRRPLVPVVGL
jgi:hypothetical protein